MGQETRPYTGAIWNNDITSGAVRLYWLARSLDPQGSGHISSETLKEAACQLGVKPRTYYSWLSDAISSGVFIGLRQEGKTIAGRSATTFNVLRVASQQRVLEIMGGNDIDKSHVDVPLKSLFKKGWRSVVWAAYLKANWGKQEYDSQGNPVTKYSRISQKKLENLTGVSVSAQKNSLHRHYASKCQIGITSQPASMVRMLNEYTSQNKYFKFIDPKQGNKAVAAVHLPSEKRVSNKIAKIAKRGRRRTILAHLQRHGLACPLLQLSNLRQADNRTVTRLFYSTPNTQGLSQNQAGQKVRKYEKTLQILLEGTKLAGDPESIFIRRGNRGVWDVYPVGMFLQRNVDK